MSGLDWMMPAGLVDAAFPFHLVLDEELTVVAAGTSITQLHDNSLTGRCLLDLFTVDTPKVTPAFSTFAKQHLSLIHI